MQQEVVHRLRLARDQMPREFGICATYPASMDDACVTSPVPRIISQKARRLSRRGSYAAICASTLRYSAEFGGFIVMI